MLLRLLMYPPGFEPEAFRVQVGRSTLELQAHIKAKPRNCTEMTSLQVRDPNYWMSRAMGLVRIELTPRDSGDRNTTTIL